MRTKLYTLATLFVIALSSTAMAASDALAPKEIVWPFDGFFGTVDRQAAQRGYQVYKEVCTACHGLERVAFRNLVSLGFSEDEAKALAAEKSVIDGPNDEGEMFERPGRLADYMAGPFANEKAARASNNGAYPPDLSLIVKARPNGANYVYSLLTGYKAAPANVEMGDGMHYNPYFPGGQIAMAAPLSEGAVEYVDGTIATTGQMARDLTIFLQWASEPEMEQRKQMGIKVILYLVIFTIFFILAKNRIWSRVK